MTLKALGACATERAKGIDFFPDPAAGRWAAQPAKDICANCFVRGQCLDEALRHNEAGIWGGTTERDRKILKDRYVRHKALDRTLHRV